MNGDFRLAGRVALVTGASRGLGRALSIELGRRGMTVGLVARGAAALAEAAAEVEAAGGRAIPLAFDVADKLAIHRVSGLAAALGGEVDVLVHNASTLGPVPLRPLLDLACEDLEAVLATNLVGPFRLTKAVAGSMALRRTGVIAFVSSDAAVEAYPTWGAYGASKAAADHLARTLAAELGEHGVRVFSVDPGEMDTAMHAAAIPDADRASLARPADVARAIARMIGAAPSGARLVASGWAEGAGSAAGAAGAESAGAVAS